MRKRIKKSSGYKKVGKDFCGVCEVRQLPKGAYFRTVDKSGKVSRETYIKDYYEPSSKRYCATKCSDVLGNGRMVKGTQKVTTNFYY